MSTETAVSKTVFIGNLSQNFTAQQLHDTFSSFGPIVSHSVKGRYGFVEFESEEIAKKCVEEHEAKEKTEESMIVEFARPIGSNPRRRRRTFRRGGRRGRGLRGRRGGLRGRRGGFRRRRRRRVPLERSTTTLYVTNLPFSYTDEQLKSLFEKYEPVSAQIVTNKFGKSRGVGFVELKNEEDQKRALEEMKGAEVSAENGNRKIFVRIARVRRQQQQQAQETQQEQTTEKESPKE